MFRRLAPLLLSLAACAAEAVQPPSVAPPASPPPASPAASPSPARISPALPSPPPPFEAEYPLLLEQMLRVDTSHGGETRLLEPIAALYRDAGVPVQILESAPGRGNLIARLKGGGAKKPMLLLAHVDVVPVDGQPWTVPPFDVTSKDGFLWGRGINDDKAMAAAIVATTLELARARMPLARDVIVALTAGEETGGVAGVGWLVENRRELLDAEIALNEGGFTLLTDDFAKPVAVYLGVSEKSFQTFRLVAKGKGGHSSRPPTRGDPVVALARALVKVGQLRFEPTVLPETKADFESELAVAEPEYKAALGHAIASAPRLAPADDAVLSRDPSYNAAVRTTCVTTMLQAAPQDNVLPTTAEATINCRLLPNDTREHVRATLEKVVDDRSLELVTLPWWGGGPGSPFEGEVVAAVKAVTDKRFPGTPVVSSMSMGASDSRFLRGIGIRSYGVSPNFGTRPEARAGHAAHGPDERRPEKWLVRGAEYFRDIVRTLAL